MSDENKAIFTVFHCGPPKDHKCDSNGPWEYYMRDPEGNAWVTHDESVARKGPCSGGSVTCSKCGLSAQELAMWQHEWE